MPKTLRERFDIGKPYVVSRRKLGDRRSAKVSLQVVTGGQVDRHPDKPITRGDCIDAPRPCPWVSCRHHLYLDVNAQGGIQLNFPGVEPWQLVHSCSLDLAELGGIDLPTIGEMLNVTKMNACHLERSGLRFVRDLIGKDLEL